MLSSYRPRNDGHDYYGCGTYLITLVVSGREQLLSHLITEKGHMALRLTPLGEDVIAYVNDNERRAVVRRLLPDYMRRCLHVQIGGRSYGAFGNLFLLRWPRKVQVQCHRRHPITRLPYEQSDDYAKERKEWERSIIEGGTVIVTPGISRGELLMKNECIERHFPLIHLQKEAIGPYWKPEKKRFDACAEGTLLILVPWNLDEMGAVGEVPADSDYSRFHNLNSLAAELCSFTGDAKIMR